MLTGHISEFSNPVIFHPTEKFIQDRLFFQLGKGLYEYDSDQNLTLVFEEPGVTPHCFANEGLWVVREVSTGSFIHEYIDLFNRWKSFDPFPVNEAGGYFFEDYCFIRHRDKSKKFFSVYSLTDCVRKSAEVDNRYHLLATKDRIYANSKFGEFVCFDYELNRLWSSSLRKRGYAYLDPVIWKNNVIVNRGATKLGKKEGVVSAFDKHDGSLVWERIFPEGEANIRVFGDRIYAAQNGVMHILSSETGELLFERSAGSLKNHVSDLFWPLDDNLVWISFSEALILVYSGDGRHLVQKIGLPEPYVPYQNDMFTEVNDRYYLGLNTSGMALSGVCYGLLSLNRRDEAEHPAVTIEERPYTKILTLTNEQGEEYYHVIVIADRFEDVIRYGSMTLKEYAQVRGARIWTDGKRNEKFNGQLLFSTDIERYGEKCTERLEQMIAEVNRFADVMDISAGNGRDLIHASLAPMPDPDK